MSKKTISPGINIKTADWYEKSFKNINQGGRYVLECMPELYGHTMRNFRNYFTGGELGLIIDVQNGCFLIPQMAGGHIIPNVENGIALDNLHKKWKIDEKSFIKKLKLLKPFEIAILEIWANIFWNQKTHDINTWISGFASKN